MSSVKLEYFNIVGVAEKVRLALFISGTPFEDVRLDQAQWTERKKSAKFGQLPILTLPSGEEICQSDAMLRWAGSQGDSALYPPNAERRLKIDEMLGLCGDMDRAWRPCVYLSMRPEKYGYPKDLDASQKGAIIKALREAFLAEDLPLFASYFSAAISSSGGPFLTGSSLTIADLQCWASLSYFTKGIADHVPTDCFAAFPVVMEYLSLVAAHPQVLAYYASK
jgi:glutathione S-transferase